MDAAHLSFEEESFDHVTFFYSLMYMDRETQHKAIREAARVLKKGGFLLIWDTVIQSAYPEPFLVDLCIGINGETIQTTYGVVKKDAAQSENVFMSICEACGLTLYSRKATGTSFSLVFTKRSTARRAIPVNPNSSNRICKAVPKTVAQPRRLWAEAHCA